MHLKTSPFVLIKILKLYNKPYFDEAIKPMLKKQDQVFHKIDLGDDFTLTTMIQKAEIHEYQDKFKVIEDFIESYKKD